MTGHARDLFKACLSYATPAHGCCHKQNHEKLGEPGKHNEMSVNEQILVVQSDEKIFSGTRMKLAVDLFQPLLIHVSVNLGRRDVGVPEHFLNHPKISAIVQQMGREAVPE